MEHVIKKSPFGDFFVVSGCVRRMPHIIVPTLTAQINFYLSR